MSAELISCPFCGGAARVATTLHATGAKRYYPECLTDGCPGRPELTTYATEAKAVAAWNARHTLSDHHILLAVQRQVAAKEKQIAGLVAERDILRARITELEAAARTTSSLQRQDANPEWYRAFGLTPEVAAAIERTLREQCRGWGNAIGGVA